jgi:hypothetical protein
VLIPAIEILYVGLSYLIFIDVYVMFVMCTQFLYVVKYQSIVDLYTIKLDLLYVWRLYHQIWISGTNKDMNINESPSYYRITFELSNCTVIASDDYATTFVNKRNDQCTQFYISSNSFQFFWSQLPFLWNMPPTSSKSMLHLNVDPEDGDDTLIRNVGLLWTKYTA